MATFECSMESLPRKCKTCGTPVGKSKQYCEPCCIAQRKKREKSRLIAEKQERAQRYNELGLSKTSHCLVCGKELIISVSCSVTKKFCSSACKIKHWKATSPKQKEWERGGSKYLERENRYKERRKQRRLESGLYTPIVFKKCSCGESFIDHSGHLDQDDCVTCSGHKERDVNSRDESRLRQCKCCGVEFSALYGYGGHAYCSDDCANKIKKQNNKKYKRDHSYANHLRRVRRRRAKAIAGELGKFKRIEIFERDKWKCKLCGKKVDKALKYPHPMSAVLDHIIPIACGGLHTRENTQLTHNCCNYMKQHNGGGEQLWLIGW